MENRLHSFITSIFLGSILGLIGYVVSFKAGGNTPKLDGIFGVIFGTMSSLISYHWMHENSIYQLSRKIEETARINQIIAMSNAVNVNLNSQLHKLSKLPLIVQETSLAALQYAIDGFDFDYNEESSYIRGRRLALSTYARFWSIVLSYQEKIKRPLVARMTHSTNLETLHDDAGRDLEAAHRRFADRGKLFRILIDLETPDPERIARYISALNYMKRLGVRAAYINISDSPLLKRDFSRREFCIISELNFTTEWKLRENHEVKALIVGTEESRFAEHLIRWEALVDALEQSKYDFSGNYVSLLKDFRDYFIKSYFPYRPSRQSLSARWRPRNLSSESPES